MRQIIYYISIIIFLFSMNSSALISPMPKSGDIIGKIKTALFQRKDNYAKIPQKFDIGYYELYEANPGINPDIAHADTVLIIPTRYILPKELNRKKDNIVINLAEMRLYYYNVSRHKIYSFPIGIGKEGWNTPVGKFKIIHKIKHPTWFVPSSIQKYHKENGDPVGKIVPSGPNNPMGDYALRLSNPSYLIHGTDDPIGIGRRSSAGCIRLYPKDIEKLFYIIKTGTPVTIIDSPYKVGFHNKKLYLEAHMPLLEQRKKHHGYLKSAVWLVEKIAKKHHIKINKEKVLKIAKQHVGVPQGV